MKVIKKVICLLLIVLLSACSGSGNIIRSYHTYTIYPIGYLLNRIGGNRISYTSIQNSNIVQNANLVDNYEEILNDSIYFYYINGLEPYIDIYDEEINNSGVNRIDLSSNSIYDFKRYTPINVGGNINYVESDYYEGSVFEYADAYNDDYFIWLDPIGMLSMAKSIYNNLSSNYAEAADYFKKNYENLENDLISLDAAYQNLATTLQKEGRTIKFVSMTPSFGSWQKAYGFEVYPICLSRYGALPTESQLQIIKDKIKADGVQYIAYEPNLSTDMLGLFLSLETELGLKRVNLSNISSLTVTQQTDNKDYLTLMYENLSVLENIATQTNNQETPQEVKE